MNCSNFLLRATSSLPIRCAALAKACLLAAMAFAAASNASAQTVSATAQMTSQPGGPGLYNYTITLNNTGTLPIQTFWYAWVPNVDFLPSMPGNAQGPGGWNSYVQGGGYYNGYSIEFLSTSTALAPGGQAQFTFTSPDSPTALAGSSPYYIYYPVGTSFVYNGIGTYGAYAQITVQSVVPEPSLAALLAVGVLGGWGFSHLKRRPRQIAMAVAHSRR